MSDEALLREKTATLARMLDLQGTIGMFGHVSVRVPGTDRMLHQPGGLDRQDRGAAAAHVRLQHRRHHHRASRRIDPAGVAHPHPDPPRPARRHVRRAPARAARPRARGRRQGTQAGVPARLVPLHRRADLEQSAPGGERRAGRRPVAHARPASLRADARPRQRRGGRHRRGGVVRLHVPGGERANPASGRDHGRRHCA